MILAARRQNPPARGPPYVAQASSPAGSGGVSPPEWRRGPNFRTRSPRPSRPSWFDFTALVRVHMLPLGSLAHMWQTFIFGVHWSHEGKMYYDELPAGSKEEAAQYFNEHKRSDVTLVRVELVGPDDPGVREVPGSPVSPFSPLKARRK